jgi:hypothetical protein
MVATNRPLIAVVNDDTTFLKLMYDLRPTRGTRSCCTSKVRMPTS